MPSGPSFSKRGRPAVTEARETTELFFAPAVGAGERIGHEWTRVATAFGLPVAAVRTAGRRADDCARGVPPAHPAKHVDSLVREKEDPSRRAWFGTTQEPPYRLPPPPCRARVLGRARTRRRRRRFRRHRLVGLASSTGSTDEHLQLWPGSLDARLLSSDLVGGRLRRRGPSALRRQRSDRFGRRRDGRNGDEQQRERGQRRRWRRRRFRRDLVDDDERRRRLRRRGCRRGGRLHLGIR